MSGFASMAAYKAAALRSAKFEPIDGGSRVFAEIPGFDGVWAEGRDRAGARRELETALDGWIELRQERGLELPSVNGQLAPSAQLV